MTLTLITPLIGVPAIALAGVLLLGAIGSGPAVRIAGAPLLAPVLGLALVASVLTTAAHVVPLGVTGPLLLVGGGVASTVWAIGARDKKRLPTVRSCVSGALATSGGLVIALVPPLGHRTYGPVNLHFNDSWFYASVDWFLRGNRLGGPIESPTTYPPTSVVQYVQAFDVRVGIDAWQASFSALIGIDPSAVQSAAQASTVGIISLTAYSLARHFLKLGRVWSLLAAAGSLSPVTVQLFADPRPANLAAIAIAPVCLTFAAKAVSSAGSRRDAVVAGMAAAGLAVTYTEHVPTVMLAAVGSWLVALAFGSNGVSLARRTLRQVPVILVTAVALSPLGAVRALNYARELGSGEATGSPPQAGVSLETLPVLLAGTFHLHELDEVVGLNPVATTGLYNVAMLILGFALIGSLIGAHRSERSIVLLPAAAVLAASVALYAYFERQGTCGDCVYKSVTLSPVFLAVATVGAAQALWQRASTRPVVRVVAAVLIGSYGGLLVRGQAELLRGTDRVQAAVTNSLHALPSAVSKLPPAAVLVEGASSSADFAPFFHGPQMLYLLGRDKSHPLRYERSLAGLVTGFGLPEEPFRGDYRYVVSGYPGLQSDRRTIRDFGEYVLQERTGVDVLVLQSAGARDPRYRRDAAIPWVRGPFAIRVQGIERGGTLVLRFTGGVVPAIRFRVEGFAARQVINERAGEALVCVRLPPGRDLREMTIVPGDFAITVPPRQEVDGPALSPKGVGLAGWSMRAREAPCRATGP